MPVLESFRFIVTAPYLRKNLPHGIREWEQDWLCEAPRARTPTLISSCKTSKKRQSLTSLPNKSPNPPTGHRHSSRQAGGIVAQPGHFTVPRLSIVKP